MVRGNDMFFFFWSFYHVTAKSGLVPSILGLVPPFSNPSNKFDIYES
jgi:hypothetical protein